MDKKKHIITMIAIMVVIAGGTFYGGMQYGTSKATAQLGQGKNSGSFGGAANGQGGGQRGMRAGGPNGGGGFAGGQITAKDDTSITIKARNGSSQIVFYSPSTTVDKSVGGAISDLSIGQQVTVSGSANPDGSLAATNIAIRPADAGNGQGTPASSGN
jgi:hypothetical protein